MNIALETSLVSAGTSFVVLMLGQILWPMMKDWRSIKSDATYLAIRIVCVLDKFVEDCASTAIDDGEENEKGESIARVTAPAPPHLSDRRKLEKHQQHIDVQVALPTSIY